jgi:RecA-family ATPase
MADKRSDFARLVTPAGAWLTGEAPPPIPSLVTDGGAPVMARGISAILASPGGCGKTTAALELALLVAAGGTKAHRVKWLDRFDVEGGRVLYVNGEDHGDTLHRRLYALAGMLKPEDRKRAGDALHVAPMAGEAAALVNANGDRTQLAREIEDHLASSQGWALVVIDPVARFGGQGDENDNRAATQLVNVCERFTRSPGWPSVLLLHHTRKLTTGAKAKDGLDVEQLRGASGFKDAARWVAMMAPDNGKTWFKVVKNNDGPQSGEIELRPKGPRFVAVEPPAPAAKPGPRGGA